MLTGASAGIGEGTAMLFAQHGCHLTLTGRDQERLNAVVQQCIAAGTPADKVYSYYCLLVTSEPVWPSS